MANKLIRKGKLHGHYQSVRDHWNHGRNVPWLNIRGLWLERAGFQVGDAIEITVENGVLIVKKVAADGNH
ncbi:SymE family type I addiction module toxin [Chitinophaga sp. Hz27]|uniref:SymE family type I addiction module toxin n=1 Tax=Chitinophaga sp. Hz27 TaxID=3347169 RepID=UPI0035DC60EC